MSNGNGKLLTIAEAAESFGVNKSTLYKYIEDGRISIESRRIRGKLTKHVKESEITAVFDSIEFHRTSTKEDRRKPSNSMEFHGKPSNLKENIREVIEEYFQTRETQIMKPLQEQALYLAGKYECENKFLKERLETLREENEILRAQIKTLPGPVEEITRQLQEYIQTIEESQEEKEQLIKEKEEQIRKAEEERKNLEVQQEHAMKEQEVKLKAEAEEQMKQLAEAWKKELEQARRPWWKFW